MSTLKTNTLSNVAGTQSIGVDRVAQGTAAAWVNFNGTGTVAIRAQYNVSSITDNGTGDYTVNFTTALADTNYSVVTSAMRDLAITGSTNPLLTSLYGSPTYSDAFTTTSVRLIAKATTVSVDALAVTAAVFR